MTDYCTHPKNMHRVINNGGIYCKSCGATNILKSQRVVDDNGRVVFIGNLAECEKFIRENVKVSTN